MNKHIDVWLKDHPDWILRSELINFIDPDELVSILKKHEFGYITGSGDYFSALKDVNTFVGIKMVIRAKYLTKYIS